MKITFKARTAYGLGGKEWFIDTVDIPDTPEWIEFAKRKFSIRFGVDLDKIEVIKGGGK